MCQKERCVCVQWGHVLSVCTGMRSRQIYSINVVVFFQTLTKYPYSMHTYMCKSLDSLLIYLYFATNAQKYIEIQSMRQVSTILMS